ncbi:MAG: ABC-type polysaccharide/polyol phosphate export permease [Vicingaceae bacterium]|jgi:ABC-type polysaccharide/polyol phosphate export permease
MKLVQRQKDLREDNRLERIWLMAKIEFKLRYYENKLGLLWALIKPLVQMAIYYVAFALILRVSIENYALYLFIGLIVWGVFTESTSGMIVVLKTKKYLYEYSNMSKIEIYLSSLISIAIGFLFNLGVFIVALYFGGLSLGLQVLWLPLIFLNLFLVSLGISMILSNIYLIIKDVQQIWSLVLMFLFWVSPLLYSYEYIVQNLPFLSYINPMAGVIINFRNVMMYNIAPDFILLGLNFIQGVFLLLIGFFFLKKIGVKASEIK